MARRDAPARRLRAGADNEANSMTRRQDFSSEEWRALRNAPQLVAIATAAAGHSGFFGTLSEGMSAASAFAAA